MKDMNLMSTCIRGMVEPEEVELISDGFHTFKELYDFRLVFNACLFNEWAKQGVYGVHKSRKHGDGEECFGGGWFVVMATTPFGQVSNHYRDCHWGIFECESREKADAWDGHSAGDVVDRLRMVACSPRA
ncbi:hypothetical protein K0U83_11720 [bacterium]|nr:hypothetical protein [bacterium]